MTRLVPAGDDGFTERGQHTAVQLADDWLGSHTYMLS